MLKQMLNMLTSALQKSKDSQIGKIMIVFHEQHQQAMQMLQKMESWNDIENASGKELDVIGADINQPRGLANDVQYRMLIRSKRARARADGTMNSIIDTMAETLNCKKEELTFKTVIEAGGTEVNALIIEAIPLKVAIDAELTPSQIIKLTEQVAAGDVRVASANFVGTFRFSKSYSEPSYNSGKGFGVGKFGLLLIPSDDIELPI